MARSHIQRAKKRPFHSLSTSRGPRFEATCRAERKVCKEFRAEARILRSGSASAQFCFAAIPRRCAEGEDLGRRGGVVYIPLEARFFINGMLLSWDAILVLVRLKTWLTDLSYSTGEDLGWLRGCEESLGTKLDRPAERFGSGFLAFHCPPLQRILPRPSLTSLSCHSTVCMHPWTELNAWNRTTPGSGLESGQIYLRCTH